MVLALSETLVDPGEGQVTTHAHGCDCSACQENKAENMQVGPVSESREETEGRIGDTPGTAGSITPGSSLVGIIDYGGDTDLYRVTLQAGQVYDITMTGGSLGDPLLRLYDAFQRQVAFNDDFGGSFDSQITYTPASTGTYYISAEAYDTFYTGTYTLSVGQSTSLPAPVNDWRDSPNFTSAALDSISWDSRLSDGNISVYFTQAGEVADGVTSEGFTSYERAQFQRAFEMIEAVTNLRFTVVNRPDNVDMQLVLDTNEIDFLGYFKPPGETGGGVGVFAGDDWDRSAGGDLTVGGYGFQTIVHELLHGLGLAHPHDDGGSSIRMPGVTSNFDDFGNFDLNQGVYTTMSYNRGLLTGGPGTAPGNIGSVYGVQSGPMALDIAVLQKLYGENTTHNSGNDNYYLDSSNGLNTYWESIWDSGGIDAIRHIGPGAANIDLREATLQVEEGGGGYLSSVDGIAGGFTIANGTVIERAFGGGASDTIRGNAANNVLVGEGGFDTIYGGAGDDFINGGAGADSIYAENGDDQVVGGDGYDQLYGGNGNDTLNGGAVADALYGGAGDDRLVGGTNLGLTRDQLYGGDGTDSLYGGGGFDLLNGDAGDDYMNGGQQADNIFGGSGNDTMVGEQGLDRLFGGLGNDVGFGGDGNDGLFGAEGNDTLYGQLGNDRFFGGSGNDQLFGNAGADTIGGGSGFDRIDGGTGNDFLVGNFNADVFVFANGHGNDTVADFDATNPGERLDFSALTTLNSVADVLNAGGAVGVNYLIQTGGGNTILLGRVSESDLDASDFIF